MQYGIAFAPLVPTLVLWIGIAAIIVIAAILMLTRARGAAIRVAAAVRRVGPRLGRGLKPCPESGCREEYSGQEVSGELVVSGCDPPEMLQFVEEPFDEVAQSVKRAVDGALDASVAGRGDVTTATVASDQVEDGHGVVASVGDYVAEPSSLQEGGYGGLIGRLSLRQNDPHRQPATVDQSVDLRGQSTTRTTDGVIRAPFFPPAAC
mgnify:CR=1 FL=1